MPAQRPAPVAAAATSDERAPVDTQPTGAAAEPPAAPPEPTPVELAPAAAADDSPPWDPAPTPTAVEAVEPVAAVEPEKAAIPEPAPAPTPARASSGGPDTEVLRRRWPEVLETVKGLRRVTWALIDPRNAQVAELDATTLRVAFDNPALATTFRNGAHADVVARAVRETLGFDVRVEGILAEQVGAAPVATAAARPAPDDRANPRAVTPAEAAASWDDEPPMPEPPDDEPGEPATPDAPPQDLAPPPSGTARERGMAAARESASRSVPGVPDDPSPDDPDITTSSLMGAPLVAQMLGGTVIDEQLDDGSS
ncbi:hypothetical protein HP550_05370 [Cellulomonas humilata]|uniref:DNA polymerase III subunit gamma/tau n=1 Tax=Cellulomonas humilata TaxID=144055 RepID=A0A7Y5ZYV5_9CELL|nr:hypothetical protein [Cellulomonas humilata]